MCAANYLSLIKRYIQDFKLKLVIILTDSKLGIGHKRRLTGLDNVDLINMGSRHASTYRSRRHLVIADNSCSSLYGVSLGERKVRMMSVTSMGLGKIDCISVLFLSL